MPFKLIDFHHATPIRLNIGAINKGIFAVRDFLPSASLGGRKNKRNAEQYVWEGKRMETNQTDTFHEDL